MYKSNTGAVIARGARFMPCTLTDDNSGKTYEINVKEPKLKVYRQFEALNDSSEIEDIIAVTAAVLSSNKENIKITTELVEEVFTLDEITQFFEDFTSWIANTRNNDPN